MGGFTTVTIVGRVGKDPEVRYFESGSVVAKCSIAIDSRQKGEEKAAWYDIELWNKTAEVAANYVTKGSLIGVEGSLATESWIDKETGKNRSRVYIKGIRLNLLGSKGEQSPSSSDEEGF